MITFLPAGQVVICSNACRSEDFLYLAGLPGEPGLKCVVENITGGKSGQDKVENITC